VDHFGRKPLLMTGSIGMFVSLVVVGAMFLKMKHGVSATDSIGPGMVTLVALVVFIASFAFSLGPVVWTIINEIYPAQVRGKGVAVATAANWLAAWAVSQFFLSLVNLISETGVFWLFAFFCLVTYWFVHRFVPETKGRSLEQLQAMWGDEDALAAAVGSYRSSTP
jgi:MFS family permease